MTICCKFPRNARLEMNAKIEVKYFKKNSIYKFSDKLSRYFGNFNLESKHFIVIDITSTGEIFYRVLETGFCDYHYERTLLNNLDRSFPHG